MSEGLPTPPKIFVRGNAGLQAAFNALLSYCGKLRGAINANRIEPGAGVEVTRGASGTVIEARSSSSRSSSLHPWKVTSVSEGEVHILGGTIGGVTVDTEDMVIDEAGTEYIWLEVTCALTVVNDFVLSWDISMVILDTGSAVPEDNILDGVYHVKLATFVDGALTVQNKSTDLGFRVIDDGTQTGSGDGETWAT